MQTLSTLTAALLVNNVNGFHHPKALEPLSKLNRRHIRNESANIQSLLDSLVLVASWSRGNFTYLCHVTQPKQTKKKKIIRCTCCRCQKSFWTLFCSFSANGISLLVGWCAEAGNRWPWRSYSGILVYGVLAS